MAQFTIYENPNRVSRKTFPFLLDIQADLLNDLRTTILIPLCPAAMISDDIITKLCPVVEIQSKRFIVLTQQFAAVDRKILGKAIADLSRYRPENIAALDFIVSGI
jgi:toxin CcdB